jgi:prefoldin alpha subunit
MDNPQARQMEYEAKVYSEQLRLLQNEIERISMTALELSASAKALSSPMEGDALVPIGAGSLIRAKVDGAEVLLPIGAGYMIAMKKHEAVDELKRRMNSTEAAVEKLKSEFHKTNDKLGYIIMALNKMDDGQSRRSNAYE